MGFVYIWRDAKRKKFYIGSHFGSEKDAYICSNRWMLAAYKKRPQDFKRRILERVDGSKDDLLMREQAWLNLIPDEELSISDAVLNDTARYYNHKKIANGGSRKGHKKNRVGPSWNKGVTKEMLALRRAGLLCLMCDQPKQPKTAIIYRSCPLCCHTFSPRNKQVYCSRRCAATASMTPERRQLLSDKRKGSLPWNKGASNPTAAENGRKGASKLAEVALGRKRLYREDGTWTWQYPNE